MLSPKQKRSFAQSTAAINVLEGAVRSGKTISSLLRWAEYVAEAPKRGELSVIGKTTQTIGRNVFAPLADPGLVGHRIANAITYTIGAPTASMFGRTVHVIGANDAKAEPKIRGLTGAGSYVDELTVLPEEFWNQLVARQSIPGAKIFATTNPDNPAHWLRKKWLTSGNPSVRSWHFTLDDNPFLDPDYVAHLKRSYTGLWYRRFILGEWCAAEGAIYEAFDPQRHIVEPGEIPFITHWVCLAVDYGTVNPFHALIIGVGLDRRLYVTAEYRYDCKLKQRQLTDPEYSRELRTWLTTVRIPGTELAGISPQYIIVDPSAASFRVQLHRDGLSPWLADNEVLDGIRLVAGLFTNGQLRISAECPELIDEIYGYSWDPDAQAKGEDKPLKVNDHGVDALRYGLKTSEGVWRSLLLPA